MRREAYRAVDVKQVWVESLVADRPREAVTVGLDIAKSEFMAVLRWSDGSFERPWRAENSQEIPDVVQRLQKLAEGRPFLALPATGGDGRGDHLLGRSPGCPSADCDVVVVPIGGTAGAALARGDTLFGVEFDNVAAGLGGVRRAGGVVRRSLRG
jgi:hypothetical protein